MAAAKVVRQQRAPASGEADAAIEVFVQAENLLDIQAVRGDEALATGVAAAREQPADVLVAGEERVFGVDALAGLVSDPVGRALQELRGAKGVGQQDEQFAAVALLP